MTGHLVLSTLHTNSALGAFARLKDLGAEPYLMAETIIGVAAQRLVRRLCTECRAPRVPDVSEQGAFTAANLSIPAAIHDPIGCPRCGMSGYAGRVPLIELIAVDASLRDNVRAGTPTMPSSGSGLVAHGLALVADGMTSLAEVKRVTAA
jgi:general secretion pathway protein E